MACRRSDRHRQRNSEIDGDGEITSESAQEVSIFLAREQNSPTARRRAVISDVLTSAGT